MNLRIILIFILFFMSLNFIGHKRTVIRECLSKQKIYYQELFKDALSLSLIPSESFTGYIPAFIIFESGQEKFMEPQYMKLIPKSVANFLDLEKKEHLSKLLAMYGKYARNIIVFTVPLPVDAYFGLWRSYFLILIYSLFIFVTFNLCARYLVRLNSSNGWYLYLVLMGLVWVYIRYDINRSFSRTWQSILFSIPIVSLFLIRAKIYYSKRGYVNA
jgi:hypothetical protein